MRAPTDLQALLARADADLEEALWDAARRSFAYERDGHLEVLSTVKRDVVAFSLTWILDHEIGNGEFDQFFWNTGYETGDATLDALQAFALVSHEAVFTEALGRWKATGWADALPRRWQMSKKAWLALDHADADFRDLDERWWALPPMTPARVAVVRGQPERFWPVGGT